MTRTKVRGRAGVVGRVRRAGWRSIGGKWVPVFVVFARVDDAGADAGQFESGVLELDGDVVLGRFVQQGKDVALEGSEADGRVLGVGDGDDAGLTIFDAAAQFPGRFVGVAFVGGGLVETAEKVLCMAAQAVIE